MNEIRIFYGGHLQVRFQPHGQIRADEVITPRMLQPPAAPIGAEIVYNETVLGRVRCVRRERFDRWAIVFDPTEAMTIASEKMPETNAATIQPLPGTPLEALTPYLNARTLGTLAQLAGEGAPQITVEELSAKTDEALRAIDGIGPGRLAEIRMACDAALVAAGEDRASGEDKALLEDGRGDAEAA
jgi:hypothetical protein